MRSLMEAIGALAGLIPVVVCHAGFVVYGDNPFGLPNQADWYSELSSWQFIDFVSEFQQPVNDQYADMGIFFPGDDWIVTSSAADDLWGVIGGNPIGSTIDITFETPQYAFGVYFPAAYFELYWQGVEIFQTGTWVDFLGVISTQPFDQVRIKSSTGALFIDDIVWGTPWAVPGPGAIGLLGLASLVRRRRRRAA